MYTDLFKKQSGFTIMELMVVVAIIGTLSTIVMVNYASIGKRSTVAMAAQNLASDIRRVQSFALNGKNVGTDSVHWGIYFDEISTSSYVIFADKSPYNNSKDSGEDVQVVTLPKNVKIKDVDPGTQSWVVYTPPDPTIVINSSTVPMISTSTVTLSDYDDNNQKKIEFNVFGLVDIND